VSLQNAEAPPLIADNGEASHRPREGNSTGGRVAEHSIKSNQQVAGTATPVTPASQSIPYKRAAALVRTCATAFGATTMRPARSDRPWVYCPTEALDGAMPPVVYIPPTVSLGPLVSAIGFGLYFRRKRAGLFDDVMRLCLETLNRGAV
jgi:hypothetical protein